QVTAHVERLGGQARFVDGYRVTTAEDLQVVRMVLAGVINKDIVALINRHGTLAAGLSGEDGGLVRVRKKQGSVDLGFVGDVERIEPAIVRDLSREFIPVIATLGVDDHGQTYNVNADEVASAIAVALGADKLVFLTNVNGIVGADGEAVEEVSAEG